MTALIQRLRKEEKGLTLIELLAVIVIIGVIAAIAVPLITGLINNTKDNARNATANQILEAAKLYSIANNNGEVTGEVTLLTLTSNNYLQGNITDPKDGKALASGTTVNLTNYGVEDAVVVTLAFDDKSTETYTTEQLKSGKKGKAGTGTPAEGTEGGK